MGSDLGTILQKIRGNSLESFTGKSGGNVDRNWRFSREFPGKDSPMSNSWDENRTVAGVRPGLEISHNSFPRICWNPFGGISLNQFQGISHNPYQCISRNPFRGIFHNPIQEISNNEFQGISLYQFWRKTKELLGNF